MANPHQAPSASALAKLADRARAFFSPLGAAVDVTADDVLVDGHPVYRRGEDNSSAIDRIGFDVYGAHLERAAEAELIGPFPEHRCGYTVGA